MNQRGRPPKCPFCGSNQSIAKGHRRTSTMGLRRLRVCKQCRRKFTPRYQRPKRTGSQTDDATGS